ncbi:MAG: NUDIX domain-containing protein [Bacilli bacterium]|nr:NUDIX domain-containing protein [Bacilli bacterium]
MKKVILGEKKKNVKYDFRETCFGIIFKNDKFYLTEKHGELSLVGGGVEVGENHFETLKREAIEEAGLQVLEINDFVTIDCFWHTIDNREMESLANFYLVKVSDEILEATENVSNLVILDEKELLKRLSLPYQKKAIELYLQER